MRKLLVVMAAFILVTAATVVTADAAPRYSKGDMARCAERTTYVYPGQQNNPCVAAVQFLLNQYNNAPGADLRVDGDYGSQTYADVIWFQRRLPTYPDGIVGPRTWRGLTDNCANDFPCISLF